MIAFGSAVTKPEVYRRCAEPGIRRVAEPDSEIYPMDAIGSIFRSYNALLDHFTGRDGLEALVLVHQDAEIVEPTSVRSCAVRSGPRHRAGRLRRRRRRAQYRVVGGVGDVRLVHQPLRGARGRRSASRSRGPGPRRRRTRGWARSRRSTGSCWCCRRGWCATSASTRRSARFTAMTWTSASRSAMPGARSMTADFRAIHHRPLEMVPDPDEWIDAHVRVARKWDGRMGIGAGAGSWIERARRAEAEADAARTLGYMHALESDARVRELQSALAETTQSISWRITAPLRWIERRGASRPGGDRVRRGDRGARPTGATPSRACAWRPSPTPKCSRSPPWTPPLAATT